MQSDCEIQPPDRFGAIRLWTPTLWLVWWSQIVNSNPVVGLLQSDCELQPRGWFGAVRLIIILIIYIYHAFINVLSTHIIHINLNMIFYTHLYLYMQSDCELQACDWFGTVRLRTPSLWLVWYSQVESSKPVVRGSPSWGTCLLLWHGLVVNSLWPTAVHVATQCLLLPHMRVRGSFGPKEQIVDRREWM